MKPNLTEIIIVDAKAPRRGLNLNFSRLKERKQTMNRIAMILIIVLFLIGPALVRAEMNMANTLSDQAQLTTIAFDGLAFMTGSVGADSFFPPGKVADFWGFQYLRDNDLSNMGHNTDFLTKAANNMLSVLNDNQRQQLITLAKSQVSQINQYATNRFVLIDAFNRNLTGHIPAGSTGLNANAVKAYSEQLYRLDGQISYARAQVMGPILGSLTTTQRSYLNGMVGQGMTSWPNVGDQLNANTLTNDEKVAVMTYAGDMFSWYAGNVDTDVYFCPERQGTYFGSFYLKDAPAMGNPNYTISTTLTGDMGAAFLNVLRPEQRSLITDLLTQQSSDLLKLVDRRRDVATLLREFIAGQTPDAAAVMDLMNKYGEHDGQISYLYATAFADVAKTLSPDQRAQLDALRTNILQGEPSIPAGAYLYSTPINMPAIPNSDFLFTPEPCSVILILGGAVMGLIRRR
jgi:Spy/CpxP family protein refolding chaperone